jgi:hypothetical protein
MIRDNLTQARRKDLKDELSRLWELHTSATRDAGYGGMSKEESLAYDQRRDRMQEILALLEAQ